MTDDSRAPRILLIDGDRLRRDRSGMVLRRAGYDVIPAASGLEGLKRSLDAAPDAVVSDLLMPGIDGYELTLELRSAPATWDIPVILTCRPAEPADAELVNAVGGSALVVSSPDLREVLGALAVCLGPRAPVHPPAEPSRPAQLEADPLELERLIKLNQDQRERLAAQSVELAFLAGFGIGISSGADADRLLDEVLGRCAEVTGYRCGAAYLSPAGGRPLLRGQIGFEDAGPLADFFGDPALLTDAAATAQDGIARIPSAPLDRLRAEAVLRRSGLSSLLVAPVVDEGEQLGVLVLGSPRTATTANDERLIAAIAGQVARWLSRVRTISALSHSQRRTVERLARAAEFRDEETANHTERVSRYCGLLAGQAGLDEHRSELIAAASMMHDIGKLGIPDSILRKPGALNIHERLHMQRHADYGRKILAGEADPLLDLAATIAWTHHERWDGGGYPRRLGGVQIPLEGRIVAIGDVFDALTSNRVYRPAMTVDHAVGLMQSSRGTHFDPQLLDLFIDALPQVLEIRRRHPDRVKGYGEPAAAGMLSLGGLVPGSRAAFDHARALACANRRFVT